MHVFEFNIQLSLIISICYNIHSYMDAYLITLNVIVRAYGDLVSGTYNRVTTICIHIHSPHLVRNRYTGLIALPCNITTAQYTHEYT